MYWRAEVEGFIFNHVEGKDATLVDMVMPDKADLPDELLKAGTELTEALDASGDLDKIDKLIKEVEAPDDPQP